MFTIFPSGPEPRLKARSSVTSRAFTTAGDGTRPLAIKHQKLMSGSSSKWPLRESPVSAIAKTGHKPRAPSNCTPCWICGATPNLHSHHRGQSSRVQYPRRTVAGSWRHLRHGSRLPDFYRLHDLTESSAFFVIRAKNNLACKRLYSGTVDRSIGLVYDQTIVLTGPISSKY